jgi:hypothetical protein
MLACLAQRKRLVAALILFDTELGCHRTSRGANVPVPDFSWDEHVQRLSEAQFKLRYEHVQRLSEAQFKLRYPWRNSKRS